MDLSALQKFVDEEIAALGPGYPQPIEDESSGDEGEKLGEVSEDLRRLFGRIQELGDQGIALLEEQKARCEVGICTEEEHARTRARQNFLLGRAEHLKQIFWLLLRKRLSISAGNIKIVADWQVVVNKEEDSEPDGVMNVVAMLGLLPGDGEEGGFGSPFRRKRN